MEGKKPNAGQTVLAVSKFFDRFFYHIALQNHVHHSSKNKPCQWHLSTAMQRQQPSS